MLLLGLIVFAIISIEWAGLLYGIMSFFAIGFIFDASTMSDEEWNKNLWLYITAPFLCIYALACIIIPIMWISDHTIVRFNCYLNKKEFKSMFSKN